MPSGTVYTSGAEYDHNGKVTKVTDGGNQAEF